MKKSTVVLVVLLLILLGLFCSRNAFSYSIINIPIGSIVCIEGTELQGIVNGHMIINGDKFYNVRLLEDDTELTEWYTESELNVIGKTDRRVSITCGVKDKVLKRQYTTKNCRRVIPDKSYYPRGGQNPIERYEDDTHHSWYPVVTRRNTRPFGH